MAHSRILPPLCIALTAALVLAAYAMDPAAPFPGRPDWWSWIDQGKFQLSTLAFLRGELDPASHWYPLAYPLLAAPFAAIWPDHGFLPVNLVSLAATFAAALAVARRLGLHSALSCAAIALGLVGDPTSLRNWAVPWNTAPAAAFTWALLAAGTAHAAGRSQAFAIGLCWAGLAVCRPTDAITVLPALALIAWWTRHADPARALLHAIAGAALLAIPYAALHAAIYGPAPSPYMTASRDVGFTLADFPWRAYVLLIDPTEWFQDGAGLVRHYPWLLPGFAALLLAARRGRAAQLLAVTLAAHLVLYVAYIDLVPTGLWRHLNVHYFAWALPGYALLAATLARDLLHPATRKPAALALAVTLLLSALRLEPRPATPATPAKMIEFAGPPPPPDIQNARGTAADDQGPLPLFTTVRLVPVAAGTRAIALRHLITGPLTWPTIPPPGIDPAATQTRYTIGIGIGWPRWLQKSRHRSILPS